MGKKEGMIEYQGIEKYIYDGKVLGNNRIYRKLHLNRKDITIIKVEFKSKLLKLDKFEENNNKYTYIFHIFIRVNIYYLVNSGTSELGILTENIYDSYLLSNNSENSEIGNISIIDGEIKEYLDNELFVFVQLALILRGYKI